MIMQNIVLPIEIFKIEDEIGELEISLEPQRFVEGKSGGEHLHDLLIVEASVMLHQCFCPERIFCQWLRPFTTPKIKRLLNPCL